MIAAQVEGQRRFSRAFRLAPERLVRGAADGVERGLLGFRKEWLLESEIAGLRKPKNRWIFRIRVRYGRSLDSVEGRLYPRKFHRSLERFEKGGVHRPREADQHAIAFRWNRTKSGRPKKGYASPETFLRTFGNRKLVPVKRGRHSILLELRQRRGKWVVYRPAFLLVSVIRTPNRLRLQSTWRQATTRTKFLRRVNENIGKTLAQIFGERAVSKGKGA